MTTKRPRRSFTQEFKKQMVDLYRSGKSQTDIVKEYDLTPTSLRNWIIQFENTGSFQAKDNRTAEENELIELRKQNAQLRMENDILKQAALIMGRKSK